MPTTSVRSSGGGRPGGEAADPATPSPVASPVFPGLPSGITKLPVVLEAVSKLGRNLMITLRCLWPLLLPQEGEDTSRHEEMLKVGGFSWETPSRRGPHRLLTCQPCLSGHLSCSDWFSRTPASQPRALDEAALVLGSLTSFCRTHQVS